jgi:hypothetical protein
MGTRQHAHIAQPAYGLPEAAGADGGSRAPSALIPILLLFIGLAVATVWFVALPALDRPARAERSCEVIVLESGTTKCVREPMRGSRATPHRPTRHAQR